ncbi:hypothetical protein BLA6993_06714 [Burkholderia lata]|uniref:ankyrin repeat domain-containing protein n=1 Tax=Burkholderia lata (strain ATCC 17760 / DSM 23089 / LMG 22485 / NCIMB 9086 / R18194 / 383) TaxID=482957 RepID=UPI001454A44D|nr:ankyrin repeat domain-containing protein [Burkholderia lata]VWC35883.1 hypothetical protein BLA6993_06714 [Burkholderia lata]
MNAGFIVDIFEAAGAFSEGDLAPIQRLLPNIARQDVLEGMPVLFQVARSRAIFDFLDANHVNFLQRNERTGDTFLHCATLDREAALFEKAVAWYAARSLLDEPDRSGVTALSAAFKFGLIARAEKLIDAGADMSTVAANGLTPIRQALYCLDGEDAAISGLNVLLRRGVQVSRDEALHLKQAASDLGRNEVAKWLDGHLTFD